MPYVYILANKPHGSLYIGSTVNLRQRLEQHQSGKGSVHTARYNIHQLVWFAEFAHLDDAKVQESRMKAWQRAWKIREIEEMNPEWGDLSLLL